ncbi:Uncharacterised protein [Aeromonas hydrophila]|nr:Uncharacterised protein [Aeromonas hydrophila]
MPPPSAWTRLRRAGADRARLRLPGERGPARTHSGQRPGHHSRQPPYRLPRRAGPAASARPHPAGRQDSGQPVAGPADAAAPPAAAGGQPGGQDRQARHPGDGGTPGGRRGAGDLSRRRGVAPRPQGGQGRPLAIRLHQTGPTHPYPAGADPSGWAQRALLLSRRLAQQRLGRAVAGQAAVSPAGQAHSHHHRCPHPGKRGAGAARQERGPAGAQPPLPSRAWQAGLAGHRSPHRPAGGAPSAQAGHRVLRGARPHPGRSGDLPLPTPRAEPLGDPARAGTPAGDRLSGSGGRLRQTAGSRHLRR